jgi:hypothetical protein
MRQDNRTAHEKKKKEHKRLSMCVYVFLCLFVLFFYEAAELVAACLAA